MGAELHRFCLLYLSLSISGIPIIRIPVREIPDPNRAVILQGGHFLSQPGNRQPVGIIAQLNIHPFPTELVGVGADSLFDHWPGALVSHQMKSAIIKNGDNMPRWGSELASRTAYFVWLEKGRASDGKSKVVVDLRIFSIEERRCPNAAIFLSRTYRALVIIDFDPV